MRREVEIYFESEMLNDPGPGGWGAILRCGKHEKELSGHEIHIRQNRLDLTALILAIAAVTKPVPVKIFPNSEYIKKCVTGCLPIWRLRNWRESIPKAKNLDLWMKLDALLQKNDVQWHWTNPTTGCPCGEKLKAVVQREVMLVNALAEQPKLF